MDHAVRKVLQASQQGDKKTLKEVIAEGKVGVVDEEWNTPLMCAAASGREEVLRMILDKECLYSNDLEKEGEGEKKYVDLQNRYGWTALMQAACYGHSGSVVLLLQRGANVHLTNDWGVSALVLASQGGHFGVVHTLINHGAKVNPEYKEEISGSLTPLMAAAQCGHVEIIRELLRSGAELELKLKSTKWTALMLATLNNQVAVVELLLSKGAFKESCDIGGKTAADFASALGQYKNISDNEFFEAVNRGHLHKVRDMLKEKPSLSTIEGKDGATPLMFASNKGHKEVCEVLLQAKAEVNTKDKKYGWTALMHATHYKKYEVAKLLGEYGADVNLRDTSGFTAFDIASKKGDIEMIKLIANITVEKLQKTTTPTLELPKKEAIPTLELPKKEVTPTLELPKKEATSSLSLNDQLSSEDNATPSISHPPTRKTPLQMIDLSKFKSHIQNAYMTPVPPLNITPMDDNSPSVVTPIESRFPTSRVRLLSPSTSASSVSSSSNQSASSSSTRLSPSPGVKGYLSPNHPVGEGKLHSSNLQLPTKQQSPNNSSRHPSSPTHKPSLPSSPFASPQNSSRASSSRRGPLHKQSFPLLPQANPRIPSPGKGSPHKMPHLGPSMGLGRGEKPEDKSLLQGRNRLGGVIQDWAIPRPKERRKISIEGHSTKGRSNLQIYSGHRRRANTEPISPLWHRTQGKEHANQDLKSVLEKAAMDHYLSIFLEQEVDYESFLSLGEEDLQEMGITNHTDRNQLVALITRLSSQSTSIAPTSMRSDVFVFQ